MPWLLLHLLPPGLGGLGLGGLQLCKPGKPGGGLGCLPFFPLFPLLLPGLFCLNGRREQGTQRRELLFDSIQRDLPDGVLYLPGITRDAWIVEA